MVQNLWVVNNGDSTVMKVSPSSGSVVATYATGKGPFSVAFDGSRDLGAELRKQFSFDNDSQLTPVVVQLRGGTPKKPLSGFPLTSACGGQ